MVGFWNSKFPEINDITREAYEKNKVDDLQDFISEGQSLFKKAEPKVDEATELQGESQGAMLDFKRDYVRFAEASRLLTMSKQT